MPFLNSKTRFSALWLYSRYYSSENIKLNTIIVLHAIFEMFHYSSLPYYVKLEAGRKLHLLCHLLNKSMYRTNYQLLFSGYPSTPTLILMWVLRGLHSVDWTRRSSVTADGWWKQSQCPGYKAPVPISADQSVPGPCRDHTAMHTPATWYTVGHVRQWLHVTEWRQWHHVLHHPQPPAGGRHLHRPGHWGSSGEAHQAWYLDLDSRYIYNI